MCKVKEHPMQTVCILYPFSNLPMQVQARRTYSNSLSQCCSNLADQNLEEPPPQAYTTQQHLNSKVKANIPICKAITAKESIPEGYGQGNMGRQIIPQGNVAFHAYYFYTDLITFRTVQGGWQRVLQWLLLVLIYKKFKVIF